MQRVLTSVTLLGLLVLTAAAFAITEHLKLIKSPIFGTRVTNLDQVPTKFFSPVCRCANRGAQLHFTLRHRDRVTVTIVDTDGHKVATIASNKSLGPHAPQHFTWFGHTAGGGVARDGVYHPWVHLAHARRTFRFTNKITLDTKPPQVGPVKVGNSTLFGGGGRTVAIHYAFSEPAHPVVYLGTHQIILGGHIRQGSKAKVVWAGTENHRPLPAGTYTLSVGGKDLAGNETPAADRKQVKVVVRYVELSPPRVAVRSGKRFTVFVKTGARHYTWRLGGQHGAHRSTILHLRAPTTPGTYRLVVTEDGQSSTTVVRVHG